MEFICCQFFRCKTFVLVPEINSVRGPRCKKLQSLRYDTRINCPNICCYSVVVLWQMAFLNYLYPCSKASAQQDLRPSSVLEGREPPLALRQEKQYLYFGHLLPCTPGSFSLQYGAFSEEFPQRRLCTTRIWACTTGWRLALYPCSPSPALGLRVVAYLATVCDTVQAIHLCRRRCQWCLAGWLFDLLACLFPWWLACWV